MPVSPFPDDMMVRPVQWRLRGPEDFYDDGARADGTYGRCLTDYDPLHEWASAAEEEDTDIDGETDHR
jgi:hypothetical protein